MNRLATPEELAISIGENIRSLRLQRNLPQQALASQAGVSTSALRHLESGEGAHLTTLIRIIRALDKEEWLNSLAPVASINPLHMTPNVEVRQRASGLKKAGQNEAQK